MKHVITSIAFMVFLGSIFVVGIVTVLARTENKQPTQEINIQQLAWEIRKETGVNCGGYYEVLTPQKCGLIYSNDVLVINLDTDIENLRPQIQKVVSNHIASDNLPFDYPVRPPAEPTPTLKEQFREAKTDSERIDILAEKAGLK